MSAWRKKPVLSGWHFWRRAAGYAEVPLFVEVANLVTPEVSIGPAVLSYRSVGGEFWKIQEPPL